MRSPESFPKPAQVVKSEKAFFALIDKYLAEKGFVYINTCPLSRSIGCHKAKNNSEKRQKRLTKFMPGRDKG